MSWGVIDKQGKMLRRCITNQDAHYWAHVHGGIVYVVRVDEENISYNPTWWTPERQAALRILQVSFEDI